MRQRVFSALMVLIGLGFLAQAHAAHIVYPKWNGYALDWCKNFEQGCGQPAADLYCQKKGFPRSTGFQILSSVNFPTMTVGQNAICNPAVHRCDSFAYIDCQETTKVFHFPAYNGYRLDWCRQFEHSVAPPRPKPIAKRWAFSRSSTFKNKVS